MAINYGLEGKVALVTGASGGIGRAAALVFARSGASVLVSDVNEEGGAQTVAMIEAAGGKAAFQRCDVSKSDEVKAMVAAAVSTFGGLDCAFNNAGLNRLGDDEYDDAIWERNIGINLSGVMRCMREEAEVMLARGGGAIVNTASISGIGADYGFAAYNAAKAAVINYTRTVALDHAAQNIRCNAVCPGWIDTPLTEATSGIEPLARAWREAIPMRRAGNPEEIARVALFLASDEASYVTGTTVVADGGLTASNGQPNIPALLSGL